MRPYGVTLDESTILAVKELTLQLRIERLIKQRDSIFMYLEGNKPVKDYFDREGIVISNNTIDPEEFHPMKFHPIVWELNSRGEKI